jgi:hypothetical protein
MKTHIFTLLAFLITASLLVAGCHEPMEDPDSGASHAEIMNHARTVAADLDTPEKALAAGYLPGTVCEPGMGVHWVNPGLMGPELDPDRPAALLFVPGPGGVHDVMNSSFIGIEYLVITEGLATNSTETVPDLMGRPLDGPMAGHFPGMPWHADLHIYLADGMESDESFPMYHEAVVCPEGTTAPPMASVELVPMEGTSSDARGWANLTEAPFVGMLMVEVNLAGFPSSGAHAMHFHQNGDCAAPSGVFAGLPDAMIGEDGTGGAFVPGEAHQEPLTLGAEGAGSVLGRSIVVHDESGAMLLCGVIS